MDIVLREPRADDDPALQLLMADPGVRQWNPMKGDDAASWRALRDQDDETSHTWVVDEAGRPVGTVSVFDVDRGQGTCDVGYRVLPTERGRGVATAALRQVARHAFQDLGLRHVQVYHAVANPASCRVAERAGFALEGVLRQSYVYGDGSPYDEHLHARLAHDPAGETG